MCVCEKKRGSEEEKIIGLLLCLRFDCFAPPPWEIRSQKGVNFQLLCCYGTRRSCGTTRNAKWGEVRGRRFAGRRGSAPLERRGPHPPRAAQEAVRGATRRVVGEDAAGRKRGGAQRARQAPRSRRGKHAPKLGDSNVAMTRPAPMSY
jgi:hypothetical protein